MIIHQNELSEKLKVLKSISSAKLGDDLSGVLLKDKMLIANNFKTAIVVPLTDCEEAINCIIPPTAIDFIISLPEGNVEITEKDKQLIIKCGKIKSKFNTYDTDLFPETNTSKPDENKLLIDIKTVDLEKAVKQVMYACAKPNSSKPVHEGLLFDGDGIYLNIVACDGYRVAWNKLDNTNEFKMVLDKEALNKAFSIADDNICIYSNDSKSIVIKAGEYLINSRLYLAEQLKNALNDICLILHFVPFRMFYVLIMVDMKLMKAKSERHFRISMTLLQNCLQSKALLRLLSLSKRQAKKSALQTEKNSKTLMNHSVNSLRIPKKRRKQIWTQKTFRK